MCGKASMSNYRTFSKRYAQIVALREALLSTRINFNSEQSS